MHALKKTIQECCIEISRVIRHGDTESLGSSTTHMNQTGDEVKRLDEISNDIMKEGLGGCTSVFAMASEEEPDIVYTSHEEGKYFVTFDPLDGSSNIDVNITVGTIFSIFLCEEQDLKTIQSGRQIVAAGYCLYGGSTQFVWADGQRVQMSVLSSSGAFVLSNPDLRIPTQGKIYSINQSNEDRWVDKKIKDLIRTQFITQESRTMRWVGSLVADAHRTILKGGFFAYPGDTRNPDGKLRLLYESYPFAFVFEVAGGRSTDGEYLSLLDIPTNVNWNIHQRVPTILCGASEYELLGLTDAPEQRLEN